MKRRTRTLLAISALAVLLPFGVANVGAATETRPSTAATAGLTTSFDRVIDLVMQQRVAAERLSATDARIAREQMQLQFLSLSRAEQQKFLDAYRSVDSAEAALAARAALTSAVSTDARQVMDQIQAADRAKLATGQSQGMAKLGLGGPDLVFVATVGPCRVFDSRFGPGPLAAFGARQVWGFSDNPFYLWSFDQGGTGQAGSGNCAGTVYPGVQPVSVVATVAVVNTFSTGSMRAWNGGTTLTVGGILGWNAGDVLSNTTVIPMDRNIVAYPGSGGKRDFGVYNNSPTQIDFIVDVVGYFIVNVATALDCTSVAGPGFVLGPGVSTLFSTPACPTGFTPIMGQPVTNQFGVDAGTILQQSCRISNYLGANANVNCDALCCRVPGR
jgi:hypothetical protein